jgi:hypothetical protein
MISAFQSNGWGLFGCWIIVVTPHTEVSSIKLGSSTSNK